MNNTSQLYIWMYRCLFLVLVVAVALLQLLPLRTVPASIPAPDVLPLLTFSWVLRRPEFVPVWLIAIAFLLSDFFFMRPPGLWAALVVVGTEILRSRGAAFREMPFGFEWLLVAVVLTALTSLNQLLLAIAVVEAPAVGTVALQLFLNVLIYPVVVGLSRSLFKVRRLAPSELDAVGRRL